MLGEIKDLLHADGERVEDAAVTRRLSDTSASLAGKPGRTHLRWYTDPAGTFLVLTCSK